jgi:hypothetical protein
VLQTNGILAKHRDVIMRITVYLKKADGYDLRQKTTVSSFGTVMDKLPERYRQAQLESTDG